VAEVVKNSFKGESAGTFLGASQIFHIAIVHEVVLVSFFLTEFRSSAAAS
jgi:hypothetical protein